MDLAREAVHDNRVILLLGRGAFRKIKEKKMEKKINNDLAIVASRISGGAVHDMEEMKKTGVKMLRDKEWREEDGLILKEGKVYVLKDETLRVEIIRLHHDTPMGGHGGQ